MKNIKFLPNDVSVSDCVLLMHKDNKEDYTSIMLTDTQNGKITIKANRIELDQDEAIELARILIQWATGRSIKE